VPQPGWYPDPTARSPLRYWDGNQWTDWVSSGPGTRNYDPLATDAPHEQTTTPAAGWYPDPVDGTGLRYWNGTAWTNDTSG
jgi:hypothetical protein